jgi:hypothetical protein
MPPRVCRLPRLGGLLAALALAATMVGCGTHAPLPITATVNRDEFEQAEFFPFFRVYWVGVRFGALNLTAADGTQNYNSSIGESLQYGNCDPGHGPLHTGGCVVPLEITTVVWHHHSNAGLGPQYNTIVRGVPATVFNGGKSIEVYTGKQAIDIFADTATRALTAARALRPLNAPGSVQGALPPPDFCAGFVGATPHFRVARDHEGTLDCIDPLTVY